MGNEAIKYKAFLIQVVDWAKRCAEAIQFQKLWKKGRVPNSELGAAVDCTDDSRLVKEIFNPSKNNGQSSFDPKAVSIEVYGGIRESAKEKAPKEELEPAPEETAPEPVSSDVAADSIEQLEVVMQASHGSFVAKEPASEREANDPDSSSGPMILIIDDYDPLREMLSGGLMKAGYSVCSAKDGVEGLVRLHENEVGLVVTDVQMPKLDGFDMTKMLNVNDSTRDIPIIFLTEIMDEKTKAVARRLGAADILLKHFGMEDLLESVSTVMASHAAVSTHSTEHDPDRDEPLISVVIEESA